MRVGLAAVILSLAACDAALGIETLPRGRGTDPIAYASPACATCAAKSCVSEQAACTKDATCDGLHRCIARCAPNDAHCRMLCERVAPIAVRSDPFRPLDHCLRSTCTESCLGVTGIAGVFGPACACLDQTCGAETLACLRAGTPENPGACERSFSCIAQSGLDPEHAAQCTAGNKIESEASVLRRCWSTVSCPACPLSKSGAFDCVGRYRWQLPSVKTIRVNVATTTFDSARKPVKDVTVRACTAGGCSDCSSPLTFGTTREDGKTSLELPTGVTGFGGCFTFTGPGLVPMIVHAGYPLIRDVEFGMFVIEVGTLPVLGKLLGTDTLADRGHLVDIASDCLSTTASGLRVEVEPTDSLVRSGYFINNALDAKARATGALGTSLFVNLPQRLTPYSVVSTYRADALISRNYAAIVPGTITVLFSVPRSSD